jgi:LysR family nitrogen assimilation transcriptional regulator
VMSAPPAAGMLALRELPPGFPAAEPPPPAAPLDTGLPPRRLADARRVDQELLDLLPRMLRDDETITVRAVVRHMLTTGQASTITRDAWRMTRVAEYQALQQRRRPAGEIAAPVPAEALEPIAPTINPPAASLEFRDLRCFASLARTGSFGRAARELNIGQPALSHQVQRLEAGLGTQLLLRHTRGVTLTDAGSRLLDRLDTILGLLAPPLEPAAATSGTLSLALSSDVALLLAPTLVEQFRARWPRITLDIKTGNGTALEQWVLHHQADIAVIQDPPSIESLQVQPVITERLGLAIAANSPLADARGPLRLRDLADLPLILPNPRHWLRRRLEDAAFQHGVRLQPVLQVDDAALAKVMVRGGAGCAILPGMAIQEELARGSLAFRLIDRPSLSTIHAVVLRHATASPVVVGLAGIIRDAMTALVERGVWSGARIIKAAATSPDLAEDDAMSTDLRLAG